jgi:SAM-dependent methyltransferase
VETLFDAILLTMLLSMFYAALSLAPWVPSPRKHLERAFALAKIKPGERFYDLGCGDGRAVVYAAKHFDAIATGIELAFPLYLAAKIRALLARNRRVTILFGDLFKHDLADADVIYVYGMPKVLAKRLREKLEHECKPGVRIVSFVFEIQGWQPTEVDRPPGKSRKNYAMTLYIR